MQDIIVIGGGPAGGSAALFAAKAGKATLVLDNDHGLTKRAWLANHYGVSDISGPDMLAIGREQAEKFGAVFKQDKAVLIESGSSSVTVKTESGDSYEAQHVIVATGLAVDAAQQSGLKLKPGTEPRVKTIIDTDDKGRTSADRVWAAGTAAGVSMHTIITAGDGARVAIHVISELNGGRYVDHDIFTG
ncbi:FAD-dependent oxidoreductase [Paenibacillus apiarius]|uniref:FAD-dependent oxidoreductase n=1 Tax=Paenibacillus apiarius TaxID=46240 RepID=UPI00197FABFE|nr:FAD-dependent oxidoreductase [Paenibacillus apiarius]MBN3522387.1 FAD-dependent oxidoreductase [Paenibacillus apiarius]